jgi:hypothetical protein
MLIQRTTDKVENLAPDVDFGDTPRMINTTDDVKKLLPDKDPEELKDIFANLKF